MCTMTCAMVTASLLAVRFWLRQLVHHSVRQADEKSVLDHRLLEQLGLLRSNKCVQTTLNKPIEAARSPLTVWLGRSLEPVQRPGESQDFSLDLQQLFVLYSCFFQVDGRRKSTGTGKRSEQLSEYLHAQLSAQLAYCRLSGAVIVLASRAGQSDPASRWNGLSIGRPAQGCCAVGAEWGS